VRARQGRWAAGLLVAAAGIAGLGPTLLVTARPAWAFAYTIEISDNAYAPKVQPIDKGDKVIWRMPDTKGPHSVTSDTGAFDYKFGTKGATEELRFNTPGKYSYHCTYQDGMTGTIVVNDPDAPTTTSTAPPSTTTTAKPTTTTAPPATTTTLPPTTTTTVPPRPPAEVPPPVPSSAAAPPPTLATSSTTTAPTATTTTLAPSTTVTSAAPAVAEQGAASTTSAPAAPTTASTAGRADETAAGLPGRSDDGLDLTTVALVSLLVAVGLFGAWTLIRVRPGRI